MNKTFALIHACSLRSLCMHVGHARVEFMIQEEVTHVRYCYCEAEVRISSVSVVYVCA